MLYRRSAVDDHHVEAEPATAAPQLELGVRLKSHHGPLAHSPGVWRYGMDRSRSTTTSVLFSGDTDLLSGAEATHRPDSSRKCTS